MLFVKAVLLLVFLMFILFFILGLKSQKGVAPGLVDGKLAPCSSKPNCVCSEAGVQPEKRVEPLVGNISQIKSAILNTGGTITAETDSYLSATYMSSIFKFIDDVEIRVAADGANHIRSSSRVGYSDRGINRKRVDALRQALKG